MGSALSGLGATGCGSSAAIRAADAGDMAALKAQLAQRSKAGDVDVGEAQDIARHVMERQIVTAQGISGEKTLGSMPEQCVMRFGGALARRASFDDELAAHAMMLRIDAGMEGELAYAAYVARSEPHWRAVGARTLNEPFDPDLGPNRSSQQAKAARWRRDLLVDPATVVRRGALQAAAEAKHPGDVATVLEAARLDPSEDNRLLAIAALGAIGTREAVLGLKDLWDAADEDTRLAILEAWKVASVEEYVDAPCASPPQRAACVARYQLRRASEGGAKMVNVAASLAMIRGVDPNDHSTEQGNAASVVERLIDEASTRVRVHAIDHAPLAWPRLLEAINDAKEDDNPRVAAAANARLVELGGKDKEGAIKRLRVLAKDRGVASESARRALAAAGDVASAKMIDPDLRAPSRTVRTQAGELLAQLKQVSRALPLLADDDPEVRTRVACAVLDIDG